MGKKRIVFIIPPDQIDTMRHPGYPEGDNRSRNSFTWNLASKKGKIFQNIMKPAIIAMIHKIHAWILKTWDKDAFVYDDPRMQYLDEMMHEYIEADFDHTDRKLDYMHKAIDIGLFLVKEDIYYRARLFPMLNKLPIFEISTQEAHNLETFTKGVGTVKLDDVPFEREASTA